MNQITRYEDLPPLDPPSWKPSLASDDDGKRPLFRAMEIRDYVRQWWKECLHYGIQIDPAYFDGMQEGYHYAGRGYWKSWMSNEALLGSFWHWCEDMRVDRVDVNQINAIQFAAYFSQVDKVHKRKRQRVLLKCESDRRLDYKSHHKVVYFDILPAHREAFRR